VALAVTLIISLVEAVLVRVVLPVKFTTLPVARVIEPRFSVPVPPFLLKNRVEVPPLREVPENVCVEVATVLPVTERAPPWSASELLAGKIFVGVERLASERASVPRWTVMPPVKVAGLVPLMVSVPASVFVSPAVPATTRAVLAPMNVETPAATEIEGEEPLRVRVELPTI
jgi:hypothetical protein